MDTYRLHSQSILQRMASRFPMDKFLLLRDDPEPPNARRNKHATSPYRLRCTCAGLRRGTHPSRGPSGTTCRPHAKCPSNCSTPTVGLTALSRLKDDPLVEGPSSKATSGPLSKYCAQPMAVTIGNPKGTALTGTCGCAIGQIARALTSN
jgi:hypothetical protein